jgi:hypothetical protein
MVSANDNGLERLLMVEEVAELLRVPVSWVYRYADELGAFHVGKYLRFSWDRVLEGLELLGRRNSASGAPTQRR